MWAGPTLLLWIEPSSLAQNGPGNSEQHSWISQTQRLQFAKSPGVSLALSAMIANDEGIAALQTCPFQIGAWGNQCR